MIRSDDDAAALWNILGPFYPDAEKKTRQCVENETEYVDHPLRQKERFCLRFSCPSMRGYSLTGLAQNESTSVAALS